MIPAFSFYKKVQDVENFRNVYACIHGFKPHEVADADQ